MALFLGSTFVEATTAKLATKIVELRSEVENLNSEFLADKAELTNELKAKGARISQLESQIGQEEVRNKQANEKILAIKEQLEKLKGKGSGVTSLVQVQLVRITHHIENGLPFKRDKRLKEVKEITEKLEAGVITSESALGRTWALLEDEIRLGRENALHRQTIFLNGEERLATVAKIGMMSMFFHTVDNKVGYVDRDDESNYHFIEENRSKRKDLIFNLIDGLRKQIRHGRYDLPIAMK